MNNAQTSLFEEIFVDNFAGGGGASTGIELATGRPVTIAVNHDPDAILMHQTNHPYTQHLCESVWSVDPVKVCDGRPVALAWFSPDCKHFSKAKGGKPVNKKIRGLAWVVLRWAALVRPRVIMLENVEEFQTWGPVRKGKPIAGKKGLIFQKWKSQLEALGYKVEFQELRACDYGAPTIRKRFFLIARCDGSPIVWPEPTHGDPNCMDVQSGKLKPWRTAAEIIDWTLPCPSIFDTSEQIKEKYGIRANRPLKEATMRRIARGIQKYVIENPEPFIVQVNHGGDNFRGQSTAEPMPTVTSKHGYGIVTPTIVQYHSEKNESEVRGQSLQSPLQTVDTSNRYGLAAATIVQMGYGEAPGQLPRVPGIGKPLGTVVAKEKHALVTAFLSKQYGGGYTGAGSSATDPLHTITGVDHNALISTSVIKFQQNSVGQEPDEPLHTCTTATRFGLVSSHLLKMKGTNIGQSSAEPLQTITAQGTHFAEVWAFLIKYYGTSTGQHLTEPLHTATAQDRFGVVTIHGTRYAIVDIGMRMLTPRELFLAQGFPADYIIDRDHMGNEYTKTKQVARCGNSVPPGLPEALVRANLPEYCGERIETMEELENRLAM